MNFETKLVQAGVKKDETTGSLSTPIYQCATFEHPELGKSTGYDYARTLNPTRKALEDAIAVLEEGDAGFAFSSGMAAITTTLLLFKSGDHIIISDDLYGGTYRILEEIFVRFGITASYVDTAAPQAVRKAINENTVAIFIETPSNPLMKVTDIAAMTAIAKEHGLLTIVDNTFLTPYLQRSIPLGADIVIHSASKYIGGHNDVIGGLVVTATKELSEKVGRLQNGAGAILGPQDAWLLIRGLKTLALRMERQQENAQKLAEWLENHHLVKRVFYPGLKNHPGKEIMEKQASGYGAMISFEVKEVSIVADILKHVQIISFAESLGGVESLITYPTTQTHADMPKEYREEVGVSDYLLRLSVGIENIEDLINDLEQAFSYSNKTIEI